MKLSSRSRHAMSVMLELARHDAKAETPIVDMAKKYNLSQSSMEQLFARLRRSGLVSGRRGRRGGYKLARTAETISVAEIIAAVDDESPAVKGTLAVNPSTARQDQANMVWECLSSRLYKHMGEISLAEAMEMGHGEAENELGYAFEGGRNEGNSGFAPDHH